MKITAKHPSETKVKLTIKLSPSELEAAKQVALNKLSRDMKVAGFRKGKVPIAVAEKHIDANILQEQVLENALSRAVAEAFLEQKLQALERPEVEVKKFVPESELEFTAEAQIVPKVTLGNYKKLKAKRPEVKVEAKDVNEIIDKMRENFATKTKVDRAAKLGDETVIDFTGKKDGKAFDGGSAKKYTLKLGSNQFIPGFEEGIVGHKAGDEFSIDLTFPKDYNAKELAGQKVTFDVVLHEVDAIELPKVDDEFAAKCGPFTDVAGLKADIKREISNQKEREADEKYKDILVTEIAESSETALPELLIEDQMRSIEQDMMQNLSYRGLTIDNYLTTQKFKNKEEWIAKEVRPAAEKRVKAGLVLAELSRELGIEITREELLEQINQLKQQYAKNETLAKRFDDPNVHRDIANRLVTDKTVTKLVEINKK